MESPINEVLTNYNKNKKLPTKPPNNREKYQKLYEWSQTSLQKIQRLMQNSTQGASSPEFLGEQKKIILSMLLQISRLTKQQCIQKGQLVEQMLHLAVKFMNQHQKTYDMLTYRQVKNFWNSTTEMEKQYQQINQQLKKEIKVLVEDKEHRWRNLFMLIKDNRIFRRRNSKLLKVHKQLTWKIKQLEQDLINLRSQNQKYRLQIETYPNRQNSLKSYVMNQLLLNKLDERVKLYPGRARRLLKKQLIDLDINQLNTLSEKIKFIVQSMEQNGQVCQQFDAWDDNIETTRHFYNVSVQTYIETQTTGVNTIQPIGQKKVYLSMKVQARPKDFTYLQLISKTTEMKFGSNIKKNIERKKTEQRLYPNLTNTRFKRKVSNYNKEVVNNSYSHKKEYKLKIQNTVSLNFRGERAPVVKKKKIFTLSNQQQKQQVAQQATVELLKKQMQKSKGEVNENRKSRRSTLFSIRRKQYMPSKAKWEQFDAEKHKEILGENIFNFTSSENCISQAKVLEYQSKIYQLQYKCKKQAIHFTQRIFNSKREKMKQKQEMPVKVNEKKSNQNQAWKMPGKTKRKEEQMRNKQSELDKNLIKNVTKAIIEVSETDNLKLAQNKQRKDKERIKKGSRQIGHRRQNTQNLERVRLGRQQKYEHKKNHQQQYFRSSLLEIPQNQTFEFNRKNKSLLPLGQMQQEQRGYQRVSKDAEMQSPENRQIINGQKILQKILKTIFEKRKEIIGHPQTLQQFLESILPCIIRFKQENGLRKVSNASQNNKILYKLFKSMKQFDSKKQQGHLMYTTLLLQKLIPFKKCELFNADMFLLFAIMLEKLSVLGALNCFSNIYFVQAQYGLKVIEYLCSIYLSDQQTELFITSIRIKQNRINMIDAFINIVNELELIVFQSELWSFFSNFPSFENQCFSVNDIIQISSLFNFVSVSGWSHIQRLSHYIGTGFPLHRLCLYAHRFGWNQMTNIKTWLDKKYGEHFGIFWYDVKQIGNICTRIQQKMIRNEKKYKFIYRVLTQMHFKFEEYRVPFNEKYLKMCSLINAFDQIQSFHIFSTNLQYIHEAYRSLLVKSNTIFVG